MIQAPTLEDTQRLAEERATATRDVALRSKARKVWNDMGGLKRFLMDELIRERNTFAKRVMQDVREREKELRKAQ